MTKFADFNLDPMIQEALDKMDFKEPTPIQEQAIPKVLEGQDLMASAQTGTGKTAAFLLPALQKLIHTKNRKGNKPQILVLVPTRELAIQVAKEAEKFSARIPHLKTACIYGGAPYPVQKRQLSRHLDIIVATPGRLIDHITRSRLDLSKIDMLILDEADRMLDMGFIDDVERISKETPLHRQTLLFSATLDQKIIKFSERLLNDPFTIKIKPKEMDKSLIDQKLYYADSLGHKMMLLHHILENEEINQAIIFASTKMQADELARELKKNDVLAAALHGDMNQRQRTRTIDKVRQGKIKILVATDVAARGIDVSTISHVFNIDLPFHAEDYIHRIGRTGRAGASGIAITFVTHKEEFKLSKITKLLGSPIKQYTIEGMEPKPKAKGEKKGSRFNRDAQRRGRGGGFSKPGSGKFKHARSGGSGKRKPNLARRGA